MVGICYFRQAVDQADVHRGLHDPSHGVRDGLFHQLHRHLLPRLQSHPLRDHGESLLHIATRRRNLSQQLAVLQSAATRLDGENKTFGGGDEQQK